MLEIKDPPIKIFGKEIQLPPDCELSFIESDDDDDHSDSFSDKQPGDGALPKVHSSLPQHFLYSFFFFFFYFGTTLTLALHCVLHLQIFNYFVPNYHYLRFLVGVPLGELIEFRNSF